MKTFKVRSMFMAIAAILFVGSVFIGCDTDNGDDGKESPKLPQEGEVLIFSAYAGFHADGPTHNFVELYNPGDKELSLNGCTLQYAAYDKLQDYDDENDEWIVTGDWVAIPLTGTIKPKHSYLVLGTNVGGGGRIKLNDGDGDVNSNLMNLNNRGFRVALIRGTSVLTVDNPFRINDSGAKVSGFIDFVGARNDLQNVLIGWKGPADLENLLENFPRNSNQEGIRRKDLIYRNNNADEFVSVRSTTVRSETHPHGVNDSEVGIYKPKNSKHGAWDPFLGIEGWIPQITYTAVQIGGTSGTADSTGIQFTFNDDITSLAVTAADISVTVTAAQGTSATFTKDAGNVWILTPITVSSQGNATVSINKAGIESVAKTVAVFKEITVSAPLATDLMILQANTYGNANHAQGSGFPVSAIELYNKSTAAIDLTGYHLHIGTAATTTWTSIPLTGSIPAECSYLIVSTNTAEAATTNPGGIALFPTPDLSVDFTITQNNWKIVVTKNNRNTLTVANPFTEPTLFDDYVDMLGVGTGSAEGIAFPAANQSRPRVPRRISLTDTNDNSADFKDVDYRAESVSNPGFTSDGNPVIVKTELYKVWPRNVTAGAWNPITGLPQIDPTPIVE
jgi:hypothetical protein